MSSPSPFIYEADLNSRVVKIAATTTVPSPSPSPSLAVASALTCFALSKHDELLVCADINGRVCGWDTSIYRDVFQAHIQPSPSSDVPWSLTAVAVGSANLFLVDTAGNLYCLDRGDGKMCSSIFLPKMVSTLKDPVLTCLCIASERRIFISGSSGFVFEVLLSEDASHLTIGRSWREDASVLTICASDEDGDGRLIVGMVNGVAVVRDLQGILQARQSFGSAVIVTDVQAGMAMVTDYDGCVKAWPLYDNVVAPIADDPDESHHPQPRQGPVPIPAAVPVAVDSTPTEHTVARHHEHFEPHHHRMSPSSNGWLERNDISAVPRPQSQPEVMPSQHPMSQMKQEGHDVPVSKTMAQGAKANIGHSDRLSGVESQEKVNDTNKETLVAAGPFSSREKVESILSNDSLYAHSTSELARPSLNSTTWLQKVKPKHNGNKKS